VSRQETQFGLPVDASASIPLGGVYGWMCGGLLIKAITAWLVSSSPALMAGFR